jgi:hypothetical protein
MDANSRRIHCQCSLGASRILILCDTATIVEIAASARGLHAAKGRSRFAIVVDDDLRIERGRCHIELQHDREDPSPAKLSSPKVFQPLSAESGEERTEGSNPPPGSLVRT